MRVRPIGTFHRNLRSTNSLYSANTLHNLTKSIEQSPWGEVNSHPASQEMFRLLLTPEIHYRVHKSTSMVLILSQIQPVHLSCHPISLRSNSSELFRWDLSWARPWWAIPISIIFMTVCVTDYLQVIVFDHRSPCPPGWGDTRNTDFNEGTHIPLGGVFVFAPDHRMIQQI
jgi:hypothetical protein